MATPRLKPAPKMGEWRSTAVAGQFRWSPAVRAARGSDLGRTRAKKLTGVWSSTAACSGEGKLLVVALFGEQGGKIMGHGGAPQRDNT
jgi:hypothetical protein